MIVIISNILQAINPSSLTLPSVITVAHKMLKWLSARFKFILDPNDQGFDAIYMTATFLTPAYRSLLEESQVDQAVVFLLVLMKEATVPSTEPVIIHKITDNSESSNIEEPPMKCYKHLDHVAELLHRKETEEEVCSQEKTKEEELDTYKKSKPDTEDVKLDSILFWVNHSATFPLLSPVACDVLCTPASSAPIEWTFSMSGEATKGQRNRLMDYHLERETPSRKDKKYL